MTDELDPPAEFGTWAEALHWAVGVVPLGHSDLSFLASLLHQALDRPGLTDRQAKWARRILDRVIVESQGASADQAPDLATAAPAGRA